MQVLEFTHFACTSEDINNLAHALMLKQALEDELLPNMDKLIDAIAGLSEDFAGTPLSFSGLSSLNLTQMHEPHPHLWDHSPSWLLKTRGAAV